MTTMPETIDLNATVFVKTAAGQEEIQSRSLGLSPLVRRTLVLVDGNRTGAELQVFLVGKGEIHSVLAELIDRGCIEAIARASKSSAAAAPSPAPANTATDGSAAAPSGDGDPVVEDADIPGLPPASGRSAKDNEMARNFMINSVNGIIGQHTRLSLIERIFHAQGTEDLRRAYRAWESTMRDHAVASRRLPELREKLFKVL